MCDKPRGPPGWWDPTPLTLCSAVPTKGRQQGILQLLASRLLQIMSPYEKIQHKGQKVVCAAEQVARQMQRHRSPKSHFTTNLRAEAGRSTGKCTDSIWSESYFSVQWVPACSHSMQGQDSFLSKDMAEISSHPLLQHGSVQVTVNYICFHFTAAVVQEQKLPYGAATSKASSCPWKSMCCK